VSNDILRLGFTTLLQADTSLVISGEAACADDLLPRLQAAKPDVLVLDDCLPGLVLYEAVAHLRVHLPHLQILLLTADARTLAVRALLMRGVSGILQQQEAAALMVHAVHTLGAGAGWFSPAVLPRLAHGDSPAGVPQHPFTAREIRILRLLVQGQTDRQMAAQLQMSERAVRYTLRTLYNKLGVDTRLQAAVQAVRWGVVQEV